MRNTKWKIKFKKYNDNNTPITVPGARIVHITAEFASILLRLRIFLSSYRLQLACSLIPTMIHCYCVCANRLFPLPTVFLTYSFRRMSTRDATWSFVLPQEGTSYVLPSAPPLVENIFARNTVGHIYWLYVPFKFAIHFLCKLCKEHIIEIC